MSGTITMTGEEYDAMAGELDRVSRELSCLQSVIAEPDELNAEPASDYETLRRQYLSLRLLTNSALARNRYLCRRDDRDMRAALSVNAANVSAERDTNAMLTDLLEKAEAERDALHAEADALRVALLEIASANPAERGIEWAKSYASDGLKGAGSELYARWLDTFKEAEALQAENAALRAKQGERQEAVVYAVHAKGAQVDHHCPLVSPDMAADYLPGCATPLYTTPQPAPAQDVAGLASSDPVAKAEFETRLRKEFESRWPKPKGVTWGAGINDYCVSEFAEGIALSYPDMWMAYKAGAMRTNQ